MSVRLYMDEQVPNAIASALRLRGVDVLTVQDDGMESEPDSAVLDRATALGRVIFTHDDDFLAEAALRQCAGRPFAGVIYAHQLNLTVGQCVRELEMIAKASEAGEYAGRCEYLPL